MMDLWSLAGGLALARMRPILEVSAASRTADIDDVVAGCSTPEVHGSAERVAALQRWRDELGMLDDSTTPSYFQSTAAGVAILVASNDMLPADREWRIASSIGNFWDSCDDVLHAGGGYSREEFQGIKTTLRGIEDIWREGDWRLLSDSLADPASIYTDRLSKIRAAYPKRREIARIVAECAGWDIPPLPQ